MEFTDFVSDIYKNGVWVKQQDFQYSDGSNTPPPDFNTAASSADVEGWLERTLVPVALGVFAVLLVYLFFERKRKQSDTLWYIKSEELKFSDPPEIIGRGAFGLILKAEYRGTHVAVKRVLPPRFRENGKRRTRNSQQTDSTEKMTFGEPKNGSKEDNPTENIGMKSIGEKTLPKIQGMASVKLKGTKGSNSGRFSLAGGRNSTGDPTRRQLRKTFMREMRYLSKLRHSCIATVMGESNERPLVLIDPP